MKYILNIIKVYIYLYISYITLKFIILNIHYINLGGFMKENIKVAVIGATRISW